MAHKLRIAQVAPLYESVPPTLHGGTERVVSYLTEELVALGHDVTLFASGDSRSRARLIAPCARSLRQANVVDAIPLHYLMLEDVYRRVEQFDVVHFHLDYLHYPTTRRHCVTNLTTLHGRLDLPHLPPLYDEYRDMPVVSISQAQRASLPQASWVATIPHGMPLDLHREGNGGDYLVFVGRISPEKRVDRAIAIAEASGLKLKVAAKIDGVDGAYFKREIAPLMTRRCVEYLGEIDEIDKATLLRGARALIFPVEWPEPFGLVMLEALACGTPVIAYRKGAVAEVIDDGVTGFVVDDLDAAVAAVGRLSELSRHAIRERFEVRFSASGMARAYVDIYRRLIEATAAELPRASSRADEARQSTVRLTRLDLVLHGLHAGDSSGTGLGESLHAAIVDDPTERDLAARDLDRDVGRVDLIVVVQRLADQLPDPFVGSREALRALAVVPAAPIVVLCIVMTAARLAAAIGDAIVDERPVVTVGSIAVRLERSATTCVSVLVRHVIHVQARQLRAARRPATPCAPPRANGSTEAP